MPHLTCALWWRLDLHQLYGFDLNQGADEALLSSLLRSREFPNDARARWNPDHIRQDCGQNRDVPTGVAFYMRRLRAKRTMRSPAARRLPGKGSTDRPRRRIPPAGIGRILQGGLASLALHSLNCGLSAEFKVQCFSWQALHTSTAYLRQMSCSIPFPRCRVVPVCCEAGRFP